MSPFRAGVIAIAILVAGTYWAFTKVNPFATPFEVQAVFKQTNNIKPRSPVRIAGVQVGEVTKVEQIDGPGGRVTMKIKDEGLPIHQDAEMKIRPRVFLEGNFFIDIQPGSPSAPTVEDGGTIPATQTASPVQFADLLAALQTDTRRDLQVLLKEYARAVDGPGGDGFNRSIRYWENAYRSSSVANQASLGQNEDDLGRLLRGQQKVASALARNENALKGLVTNLNITAAAFAREDDALKASIPLLDDTLRKASPALAALNSSLPSLRSFAADALPGTRSSGPTLDASMPFIRQARALVGRRELRGLVADLRPTVPALTQLQEGQVGFQREVRALSSCQNRVLVPFATEPIPDPNFPKNSGVPFYKHAPRGLVGLSGESRLHDNNSPQVRAQFGGNASTFITTGDNGERFFGPSVTPIIGAHPIKPNRRPTFRPDVPCETQEPPNMSAATGSSGTNKVASPDDSPGYRKRSEESRELLKKLSQHIEDLHAGRPTLDPTAFSERGIKIQTRLKNLELLDGYRFRRKDGKR